MTTILEKLEAFTQHYSSGIFGTPTPENDIPHASFTSDPAAILSFGLGEENGKQFVKVYTRKRVAKKSQLEFFEEMDVIYEVVGDDQYIDNAVTIIDEKYKKHNGYLACGSSVGRDRMAGTMGALLDIGGELFGLSNNHVFGNYNFNHLHTQFNWPANIDTPPSATENTETIGRLHRINPFRFGITRHVKKNDFDAAIIKIDNADRVSSFQRNQFDTPNDKCLPVSGMKVKKIGRSSNLTIGEIDVLHPLRILDLKNKVIPSLPIGPMWSVKPTEINSEGDLIPFSLPGDSGSLVVTEDEEHALGIVVSGTKNGYAYISPIDPILEYFNATLVSGHNIGNV
jgi:hypothetical protein